MLITDHPLSKLHIKQSSDSGGAPSYSENSIICERNGSSDKWGIGVNTAPDLVFTLNENLKGYLDNNSNVDQIDFTGQHRCISENEIDISNKIGYIVSSNGNYNNLDNTTIPTINESLPIIKLSNESYDKAVYGVISNVEDASEIRKYSIGHFVSVFPKTDTLEKRIIINSVGEGGIFVSNINGNIENGDYITTSYIPGIGMRQNDNILHNYTVAKATCSVDFENTDINKLKFFNKNTFLEVEYTSDINPDNYYKAILIGCTYHCG